jgi:plastocyanin
MDRARARRTLLGVVGSVLLGLAAGGCALKGGGQNLSLIRGKTLFVAQCGSCHTLARAHTTGVVGPNLDDAFAESLSQGFGRDEISGIVQQQIQYPAIGGAMPKLPLSSRQAADIAAYVEYAAAKPGQDTGLLAPIGVVHAGAATEKNGVLTLEASPTGQLAYTAKTATASAGPLKIHFINSSPIPHNVAIQAGNSGATQGSTPVLGRSPIGAKVNSTFSVTLTTGTYTYFCEVPGHRQAGMWGTLTVK